MTEFDCSWFSIISGPGQLKFWATENGEPSLAFPPSTSGPSASSRSAPSSTPCPTGAGPSSPSRCQPSCSSTTPTSSLRARCGSSLRVSSSRLKGSSTRLQWGTAYVQSTIWPEFWGRSNATLTEEGFVISWSSAKKSFRCLVTLSKCCQKGKVFNWTNTMLATSQFKS